MCVLPNLAKFTMNDNSRCFIHNWKIVKLCTWIDGHCQRCEMHTLYHCDIAYSIWPYLNKKKNHKPNDMDKIKYVYDMNSRRVVIASAFGSLMNKWHIFRLFNSRVNRASKITIVCVVLHNFCINWGAPIPRPPNVSTSSNNFQGFKNRLPTFRVGKILNVKLRFMLNLNNGWLTTQLNNKKC